MLGSKPAEIPGCGVFLFAPLEMNGASSGSTPDDFNVFIDFFQGTANTRNRTPSTDTADISIWCFAIEGANNFDQLFDSGLLGLLHCRIDVPRSSQG